MIGIARSHGGARFPRIVKLRLGAVRVLTKIDHLIQLTQAAHAASRLHGKSLVRTFRQSLYMRAKEGWEPEEALRFGLLDPDVPSAAAAAFCGKIRLGRAQKALNPRSFKPLMEDKALFARHCEALGLPGPRLHAVFFRNTPGWSPDASHLRDRREWVRFIETGLPHEFVIKPATGVYGDGVRIFERTDGLFVDCSGHANRAGDVHDFMRQHPRYDSFVIQERLENHPDLRKLSASPTLQTVRINTRVTASGAVRIIGTALKIATSDLAIDNFELGATGNLMATVSESGIVQRAILMRHDRPGIQDVELHPTTGARLTGFRLPMWDDLLTLAERAARAFLPVRTVGWDIAITPRGASLIEGNMSYDPPILQSRERVMSGLRLDA